MAPLVIAHAATQAATASRACAGTKTGHEKKRNRHNRLSEGPVEGAAQLLAPSAQDGSKQPRDHHQATSLPRQLSTPLTLNACGARLHTSVTLHAAIHKAKDTPRAQVFRRCSVVRLATPRAAREAGL
jgi:hypothetical protein